MRSNASATFVLSLAEASMCPMSVPKFFTYLFAASLETTRYVASKSLLFPITKNGNESGDSTMLFCKN